VSPQPHARIITNVLSLIACSCPVRGSAVHLSPIGTLRVCCAFAARGSAVHLSPIGGLRFCCAFAVRVCCARLLRAFAARESYARLCISLCRILLSRANDLVHIVHAGDFHSGGYDQKFILIPLAVDKRLQK